jgi:hypothetical protein
LNEQAKTIRASNEQAERAANDEQAKRASNDKQAKRPSNDEQAKRASNDEQPKSRQRAGKEQAKKSDMPREVGMLYGCYKYYAVF